MPSAWLDEANPADLEALAQALREGRIRPPYAPGVLQLAGMDPRAVTFLAEAGQSEPAFIARVLERLAQERRQAASWYANVAELVWSGPAAGPHPLRDTRVVLDALFERAERHVLISSYVVTHGREVFAALGRRLQERPEIQAEFYVNLTSPTGAPEAERAEAEAFVRRFAEQDWPEGVPLPALYYDPTGRKQGRERGILHAKCVVVDDRWAFLTSANFTEAAQERNVEAGVLLDHPPLARALVGRFVTLREGGWLRPMA